MGASTERHPDESLRCLLVQPAFSAFSFWNYVEACELLGAKTPAPPLGLITVAALLPQHWDFRLLDLNTESFSEEDWTWADLVCAGGMLPQQEGILAVIDRANRDGKYVIVGGADPSSQPEIYKEASALVIGEGESAIPQWLASWRAGSPTGVFSETKKPDVTTSPVPRFDLLKFADYERIGIQYSRGCPFNCEFCDIIELYGRKPRTKSPDQVLRELDRILELGYSGPVDIVDDNFIGNKRNVKRDLLPALSDWNRRNRYPFVYATEASMNLADDVALMEAMREAEFRLVFLGIETPDPEILHKTQKSMNALKPIVARVHAILDHGIVVIGGFIMGFDGEKRGMDRAMIQLIEDCAINMAMVGLLVALPNTQLSRRLLKEQRLIDFRGQPVQTMEQMRASVRAHGTVFDFVDQTVAGLNFVPTRGRHDILEEYLNVIRAIYEPRRYFDRALRAGRMLRSRSRHRRRWFEWKRNLLALYRTGRAMHGDAATRWLFYRNLILLLWRGPVVLEQVLMLMGMFLHFRRQAAFVVGSLTARIETHERLAAHDQRIEVGVATVP